MHRLSRFALSVGLAAVPALSQAVSVSGIFTPVSGTTWHLALTLDSSGAGAAIPGLSVQFDQTLFGSLGNATVPAGWGPLLLQPDQGVPAAGVYRAQALSAALPPGQTLSSFGVDVTYLGSGAPGALPYTVYAVDGSGNLSMLFSGVTTAVPEPGSTWLMTLGVASLAFGAHRVAARKLA